MPRPQRRGTRAGRNARRRCWPLPGSHDGLVELAIEPPCYLPRQLSTVFRKIEVSSLIISLMDPNRFIAAVEGDGPRGGVSAREDGLCGLGCLTIEPCRSVVSL